MSHTRTIEIEASRFPTTRRSVLQGAKSPASHPLCFEQLVRDYWVPVYSYIRAAWGKPDEDAQDLTQEFLLQWIEKQPLEPYDPAKGRFRSYLKGAIQYFLLDQEKKRRCRKRGGDQSHLPLEETILGAALEGTPEEQFDRGWARTMLERALGEVRDRLGREGRSIAWDAFDLYELNPPISGELSYREIGEKLGRSESEVRSHVKYVLLLLRDALRKKGLETVQSEEDLVQELKDLFRSHDSTPKG